MSQRSIQQKRAAYALTYVQQNVKAGVDDDAQKRFKAYSNSLPAMIQMNGLGQALAFAYQKSNGSNESEKKGWELLFKLVAHWLLTEQKIWGHSQEKNILGALTKGTQEQYQLAQAEAQALLSWVKDFARAEIVGDAPQGD